MMNDQHTDALAVSPMRIVILQAGDYRDAVLRFAEGGPEYYHDQRFTVEFVGELAKSAELVATVSVLSEIYDEPLPNGVHGVGLSLGDSHGMDDVIGALDRLRPTHFLCRSPFRPVLRWAAASAFATLPLLADSFIDDGPRSWFRNRRMARLLNRNRFRWVANHNLPASWSLNRIGVRADKIVPFDYESRRSVHPGLLEPKAGPIGDGPFRLFYAGTLSVAKGVGDAIDAVKALRDRGRDVTLELAGSGDRQGLQAKAEALGLAGAVSFLGRMPHDEIIPTMRGRDAVLVTSRPEFNEGLPGTIYEAFCSRTPLIASDHPMFRHRTEHDRTALVFRAGDPSSLTRQVERLMDDPGLYRTLSEHSRAGWDRLQIPVGWADLIRRFLRDDEEDRDYLARHTLASGIYPPEMPRGPSRPIR